MIEFKRIGITDWAKIQKIAYETWPATFGQVIPKKQLNYMLQVIYNEESLKKQMLAEGHIFILAEKGNQLLGFISIEINYNSEPHLMVHKLYILPAAQGSGVGTKFLNLITEIAQQNNNNQLRLRVYFENNKAFRFYEKYGFKKIGTETTPIGDDYLIVDNVMVKKLF